MERSVGALGTISLRGLRSPAALPHAKRLWALALLRCAAEEALEGTRAKYEELHQAALREIATAAAPAIVTQHTAAEAEAGALPDLHQQGELEMHMPDSLMRRARARRHPDLRVAIGQAWDLLDLGDDGRLGAEGYAALFTKLHLVLLPEVGAAEARASAWEDWRHDVAKHVVVRGVAVSPRSGKPRAETDPSDAQLRAVRMGYDAFFDALFELADVWCERCDGREYALFVATLLACAAGAVPAGGGYSGGGYGDAEFAAVGALELREDAAVACALSGRISAELLRDVEELGATAAGGAGGGNDDVPSPSQEEGTATPARQSRAKELWRVVSTRVRMAAAFSSTEGWGAAVARDPTAAQAVVWIMSRGPRAPRGDGTATAAAADDDDDDGGGGDDEGEEEEEEEEAEEEEEEGRGRQELVLDVDHAAALDLEPLRPWAALRGELASLAERQAELVVLARVTRARLLPVGAGSGAAWDDADDAAAGGSGGAAHSAGGGGAKAPPGHKAVEKSIRRHLSRLGETLEAAAATSNRAAAHQQRRQGRQGQQGGQGRERQALRGGAPTSIAQMRLYADAEAARELLRRQMQGDIKRAARAAIALETSLARARGVATRHAPLQSSTRALAALRPGTASLMSMNPNARDGANGLTLERQLQRSDRKGAMDANITTVRTSGADVPCSATSWWYLSTANGGQDVPTLQDDLRRMPPTGVRNTPSRWPQNFRTGRRSRKLR